MRIFRHALAILVLMAIWPSLGHAAPYAAMVMDARNGEVIFARNHDTRLHPASLTKMMTLYVAFEAVKHGELTLDTRLTVSRRAVQTTCVCLGLREGQTISLRHLIRAAALRSANDASVVIAEGISGSVEAFAERMTRTARAMGMSNTTFRNPHGLTQAGHVSTARDMTILGRQLFFDYPQYYNIFSRRTDNAGVATVANTNRRFLDAYRGADGIKTGYTRAAGFNLTASAERGGKRIIVTMFGGQSATQRNLHVAELMDIGFSRSKTRVATRAPRTPGYQGRGATAVAQAPAAPSAVSSAAAANDNRPAGAKTIRMIRAVAKSPRPLPRPTRAPEPELLLAVQESVAENAAAVAQAALPLPQAEDPAPDDSAAESRVLAAVPEEALAPKALAVTPPPRPDDLVIAAVPAPADADPQTDADALAQAVAAGFSLVAPEDIAALADPVTDADAAEQAAIAQDAPAIAEASADLPDETQIAARPDSETGPEDDATWIGAMGTILDTPDMELALTESVSDVILNADLDYSPVDPAPVTPVAPAPSGLILTSAEDSDDDSYALAVITEAHATAGHEVIARVSTSDAGRIWGISLGHFTSRHTAERSLIAVKMAEAQSLANGISRIRQTSGRFEASFAGLTQTEAERACLRLQARAMDCAVAQP